MNVKDIFATLYVPADGTIDPAGYCSALTRGATKRGAKVSSKHVQTKANTLLNVFVGNSTPKGGFVKKEIN